MLSVQRPGDTVHDPVQWLRRPVSFSCVALQPADPPKLEQYFSPVCYRAGIGQSKWYGGAVFTKRQNKRVHEEPLRRNVPQQATGIRLQSRGDTLDAAVRSLRYKHKRELYVKKHANGGLSTMGGIPIVVNPPYNAPLSTPKHAVQETLSLSRGPLQPPFNDQHHFEIKKRSGTALSPSLLRSSTSQLPNSVKWSFEMSVPSTTRNGTRKLPESPLWHTSSAHGMSQSLSAREQTNPNTNYGKPISHSTSKPDAREVASCRVDKRARNKGKQRTRLIVRLKLRQKSEDTAPGLLSYQLCRDGVKDGMRPVVMSSHRVKEKRVGSV
ncbi:hypothetical protein CERZMDRAFT_94834 [Cercospora zeae-maydis SCOH1-5]|uniref:Uncharacterized protein n=1 Tax=Cercospora zeae-maydis SCOH1-5 TaxID=717836 RepID=A0A6A6FQ52_9PEZI|nr:hypothetical protein CERZMDRAFT_94834 [Cercospora zeae-maydis SCOH1-5]